MPTIDLGPRWDGDRDQRNAVDEARRVALTLTDVFAVALGLSEHWFRPFVAEPDGLLVNLGDLTAEWTNDRWRSTLHRVVPGPTGRRRRSTAFFFDANWNAPIECVPTCVDSTHPAKYPPVIAGEHPMAKLMGPRTLQPSDAVDTAADRHGR